ncbi:MAG: V-type ATP synthase subunit K [Caldisericaceae bacterium]|jgi:V/A-type H+-transporting ATPase subunit K|nr:V-type ATP synthase subunit K [Caldisericaceae bacterium]
MENIGLQTLINGPFWVVAGAVIVAALGGIGSAIAIGMTTSHSAGVLSEKPELFGKLLVLMSLPGTQGFYAFVVAFLIMQKFGFTSGNPKASLGQGLAIFVMSIFVGIVQLKSAITQGKSALGSIDLTGKHPEESGRAILLPGLVEMYAVLALLVAVLVILWVGAKPF